MTSTERSEPVSPSPQLRADDRTSGAGREPASEAPNVPEGERSGPPAGTAERNALLGAAFARIATASLRFLLIILALVVLGWLVGQLWMIVSPAVLGLLLATVLWPPVRVLRRAGAPPALAALIVLLGALGLLVGLGAVLAPQVIDQTQDLADSVTAGLDDLQELLTGPPLNLGEERIGQYVDSVINELQANAQTIAGRVVGGVTAAGSVVLTAVLAVVLCFFYLKDGPRFLPWLAALVGPRPAPHVTALAQRSWTTLGGFIRAQAAVGLVDAVAIGIGLAVLGVPLALPLAVLIFFGAFIPIIGAFVTGALAALVALVTDGVSSAIIVIILVLLVQQLEGNVLQPILVGRTLDLHPAVVIVAVTAGGSLYGIAGAFLSVPVVAVAAVFLRYAREQLQDMADGGAATSLVGVAEAEARQARRERSRAVRTWLARRRGSARAETPTGK